MKLSDELYVLVLPMALGGQVRHIHLLLLLDEQQGATLIDTGIPGSADLVEEALAEAGLRVEALRRILITHQDIDHVGSLHDLVQRSGARVLAHEAEVPYVDGSLRPVKFPSPAILAYRYSRSAKRQVPHHVQANVLRYA
ncbi:MAG: MBL fold metallo-hydrolase [Ardenticatenales bacterium]|nr:MBL fold metallo-hydrolase [Ardenticatenales bacterium]